MAMVCKLVPGLQEKNWTRNKGEYCTFKMLVWSVVHFTETDTIEVVPSVWISGDRCYWPPLDGPKFKAAVNSCQNPCDGWDSYLIRVLGNKYDNLLTARLKAAKAESVSDINSDAETKKRQSRRPAYYDDFINDNNDDDLGGSQRKKKKGATSRKKAIESDDSEDEIDMVEELISDPSLIKTCADSKNSGRAHVNKDACAILAKPPDAISSPLRINTLLSENTVATDSDASTTSTKSEIIRDYPVVSKQCSIQPVTRTSTPTWIYQNSTTFSPREVTANYEGGTTSALIHNVNKKGAGTFAKSDTVSSPSQINRLLSEDTVVTDSDASTTSTRSEISKNNYPTVTRQLGIQSISRTSCPTSTNQNLSSREVTANYEGDEAFKRQVLRQFAVLNYKIDQIAQDVGYLQQKNMPQEPEIEPNVLHGFDLPLKTGEELNKVENFLSQAESKEKFVNEIAKIGGPTVKYMVKRIMTRLFTNHLGMRYSWIGFKNKNNFSVLRIASVIIDAVQRIHKKNTEADIEGAIKMWLVKCKERERKGDRKENTD